MNNVKTPRYDNDTITYGFLKEVLKQEEESQDEIVAEIEKLPKNYVAPPVPPYFENSTLFYDDKLYRCTSSREIGTFSWDDWKLIIDNKELQNFIENVYSLDKLDIQRQLDSKIDTYFQDDDPSLEWDTSLEKEKHTGDRWRKKTDSGYKDYCYTKINDNPISYEWVEADVPDEIYNQINKKKSIYTRKPTFYNKDDLWIIEDDLIDDDMPDGCTYKDWVVSNTDSKIYDKTHWVKRNNNIDLGYLEKNYYKSEIVDKKISETVSDTEKKITETNNALELELSKKYQTIEESNKILEKVNSTGETVGTIQETVETNKEEISSLKVSNTNFQSSIQTIETTNKEIQTNMSDIKESIDIISTINSADFIYINNARNACPITFIVNGGGE